MNKPDPAAAAALLQDVLCELACLHNMAQYRGEPDAQRDLEGSLLDLRHPYNVVRKALLLLEPDKARLLEVLDDPNPPNTAISFEASPAPVGPSARPEAAAPQAR